MNTRTTNTLRLTLGIISLLAWALWLGALIGLFVFVQAIFGRDRALAVNAAPILFTTFERYQLLLAAVALISTVAWRLFSPQVLLRIIFGLLAVATLGAILSPLAITRKMEDLRVRGQSASAQFRKLHGQSMMIYTAQAAALAAAGILLPIAIRRDTHPQPAPPRA